jgi:hypothetical protein
MYSLKEKTIYLRDKEGNKSVMCLLSDKGYEVYKAGRKIDLSLGHILVIGDYKALLRADFS